MVLKGCNLPMIERSKLEKSAVSLRRHAGHFNIRAYFYQLADRSFATRDILTAAGVKFDDQRCENLGSHSDADENLSLLRYDAVHIGMQP